jgi:hypothetical protein
MPFQAHEHGWAKAEDGMWAVVVTIGGQTMESSPHFRIAISKLKINIDGSYQLIDVARFSGGKWDNDPPPHLYPAINAGIERAACPGCSHLHYMRRCGHDGAAQS